MTTKTLNPASEVWPVSRLKLWDKNPRSITRNDFERLKNQIRRFGTYKPLIVTPDGVILGGNMRFRALQDIGQQKIWVSIVKPKSEAEMIEIALSDNDRAGYYDDDMLAELVYPLKDKINLDDYSVDCKEPLSLDDLISTYYVDDEKDDQLPEIPTKAKTKRGDIYQLGKHRLICGDCLDLKDIKKLMNGEKAKLCFSSPPCCMAGSLYESYEDNLKSEEYIKFNIRALLNLKEVLQGFVFWNLSYNKNARWEFIEILYRLIKETGFKFLELIVWNKKHALPITSREMLTRQYEDIIFAGDEDSIKQDMELWFCGRNGKAYFNKKTNRGITNYWEIGVGKVQLENHLACFPVKLPFKGIVLMTEKNDLVVDFFGGSGTTMIAAEKAERKCYMMEMDPIYCDVIVKRWEDFTRKKAVLIDGKKGQNKSK